MEFLFLFFMLMSMMYWVGFWFKLSLKWDNLISFTICFSMAFFVPILSFIYILLKIKHLI
jgi:hypothetical protein